MDTWRRLESRRVWRCGIFDLDQVRFAPPDGAESRWFYVVDAPDWINVIPVTDDGHVLMVRQFRFGIEADTLEIPGGMCDPGESPRVSAERELLEETGHRAARWDDLGWVHPNPPVQNNRCHTFLARGLERVGEPRPDRDERFEQVRVPLSRVDAMMADGEIRHALVLAAFQLYRTHHPA